MKTEMTDLADALGIIDHSPTPKSDSLVIGMMLVTGINLLMFLAVMWGVV